MEHTPASFEVPELEKILAKKKKRYVGYEEGMALYSMRRFRSESWHRKLTHSSA